MVANLLRLLCMAMQINCKHIVCFTGCKLPALGVGSLAYVMHLDQQCLQKFD